MAIRPSAGFWVPLPRGRSSSADGLGKYVSHSESREQTSRGQSELKEASRLESPPLSLPEASVILVPQPQYDFCKYIHSSEGHFYSSQDKEGNRCQITAQRALRRNHHPLPNRISHPLLKKHSRKRNRLTVLVRAQNVTQS